jgi:hypothetical protein
MAFNKWLLTVNLIYSGRPMQFKKLPRVKRQVADVTTGKLVGKNCSFGLVF